MTTAMNTSYSHETCSTFAAASAHAHIALLVDTVICAVSILVVRIALLGICV